MKSETTVGDEIEQREGGWEFDDDVADQFDEHVSKSIPNYRIIQDHVAKIADWFLTEGDRPIVYDLGCATGTTIQRLLETQDRVSETNYVGIDEARPMLQRAEEKIGSYENVRLVEDDLTVQPSFPDATLVLSLFTLSFIPEEDRQAILDAIYRDLDRGGAVVFVEKTYPSISRFQALFREHYWDYKAQTFDDAEIRGKAATLRGQLRPLEREEYQEILIRAGFEEIEPWYQRYMWWGIITRKR